jgi:hypothetical protein
VDGALFMANLPLVLEGVYAWAAQAGGSLTKPVGKVRSAKSPRTPKVPGAVSATPNVKLPNAATITLVKPCHYKPGSKRAQFIALMTDGMTVNAYKQIFLTNPLCKGHSATGMLQCAMKDGLITVS